MFHSLQGSFLFVGYEGRGGPRTVQRCDTERLRGGFAVSSKSDVPRGESGYSLGAREQGVPGTEEGDQVVRARFSAPAGGKICEIETKTFI